MRGRGGGKKPPLKGKNKGGGHIAHARQGALLLAFGVGVPPMSYNVSL